ncbi:MAG: peptide-methionine (S)-S-oxide reductase [Candidatus Zambryskibacteria bacterium RIFCSPHIGHO2_01_FULL_43_25]|uniref:Peptide methionine sulfoxide reductase MsrA n=1 Tax=Candidatus Zambryskibacteria bacterium RIFCSPLOWO2_01_FULL_45_21 TaxID=1802761 RepID=A0A1G2U4M4_9BACT|nr:MAG: peptide-methionine (S)-S-oxide reductase [Candidatus Zambryskibacteria bacterium RIFCSPHIGHO2_01_FULL_43_25]OHB00642.1 MAG: peptide-methionine (S)-S-oxide reductase [Candidatus Zambryskibacteria bacterium RIFCSPHIGHO2_12_FULL_44_12b]OHB04457.1 MAG: peptide-methionine (S)-S-oxide reductase [Candidatus Zambryskibacteria bacterium RIFCSPLOWO2_01_FULL_45_21]
MEPDGLQQATFGAGCFWGVEAAFAELPGVVETQVGYTGGTTENPTYEKICTDKTGHIEAVNIKYDPQKITYEKLLETFWKIHDPTELNRQGPDIGSQYASAIFFHTPEQEETAKKSKEELQNSGAYKPKRIVTGILPAQKFYRAEEYHQKYLEKKGLKTCPPG